MEEQKIIVTQGVVIRSSNYHDNDKIVSILSPEYGLLSAKIKGARSGKAKLKFTALPFCYAQFELGTHNEYASVLSAHEIKSFFDITKDYSKYVCGSVILELSNIVAPMQENSEILFSAIVKALHTLCFDDANAILVLFRFFIGVLKLTGYQLNLDFCASCGVELHSPFLTHKTGGLVCSDCARFADLPLSSEMFDLIKRISKLDFDKLIEISLNKDLEKECCVLMQLCAEIHFFKLNSLKQLL